MADLNVKTWEQIEAEKVQAQRRQDWITFAAHAQHWPIDGQ